MTIDRDNPVAQASLLAVRRRKVENDVRPARGASDERFRADIIGRSFAAVP